MSDWKSAMSTSPCVSNVAVYGPDEQVCELERIVRSILDDDPENGVPMSDLVKAVGGAANEVDCRGTIFLAREEGKFLVLETTTPWGPASLEATMEYVKAHGFEALSWYLYAEEPTTLEFVNTDVKGEVFPERWYVEWERSNGDPGIELLPDDDAMISAVNEVFHTTFQSVAEVEDFADATVVAGDETLIVIRYDETY